MSETAEAPVAAPADSAERAAVNLAGSLTTLGYAAFAFSQDLPLAEMKPINTRLENPTVVPAAPPAERPNRAASSETTYIEQVDGFAPPAPGTPAPAAADRVAALEAAAEIDSEGPFGGAESVDLAPGASSPQPTVPAVGAVPDAPRSKSQNLRGLLDEIDFLEDL